MTDDERHGRLRVAWRYVRRAFVIGAAVGTL